MDFSRLCDFVSHMPETYGIPGVSLRVHHDGKEVARVDSGVRDIRTGEPMHGDEFFYCYSLSKPVTAAAAMKLIEMGKLGVNDPVSSFLPEYADIVVADFNGMPYPPKTVLRVWHLMTMTGGYDYNMTPPPVKAAIEANGGKLSIRDFARAYAKVPLRFQPGEHFSYSVCLDILAAVIEVASGMSFDQFVVKELFEPLGITDYAFFPEKVDPARLVPSYNWKADGNHEIRPLKTGFEIGEGYISGGAFLLTTADSYIKFSSAMARGGLGDNGVRVMMPQTIDLWRANRLTETQRGEILWASLLGYGYGLGVRTLVDRAQAGSYGPVGEFGWDGLKGCYTIIDPENKLALVYMEQLGMFKDVLQPRLRNLLYTGFYS